MRMARDLFAGKRPWRPTLPELRVYNYLFSLLDTQLSGLVSTDAVSKLLTKSHLHTANIRLVIQLADTNDQHKMTRREFYMAMKMVSHAQANHPISLSNLDEPAPLPVFDGLDVRKVADGKGNSSILRYAPQPTIEVDRIIAQAQDIDAQSIFRAPSLLSNVTRNSAIRALETPPESPTDSLFDMLASSEPSCYIGDSRSVLAQTPQLRQHSFPGTKSSSSSTSDLHINTDLPRHVPCVASRSADAQSVDSVTELLSRIDFMVSATHENKSSCRQLEKSQLLRAELEDKMAQLQKQLTTESEQNEQISARLVSEEECIQSLSAQLVHAQKNIAYVAQQRAQMVDRLQKVEEHQKRIQMQIKQTAAQNDKNADDVTLLDNKMFGMERRLVRMQRHMNSQDTHRMSSQSSGSTSSGTYSVRSSAYSSSSASVYKRYETTKRNRLSTVFRKQAVV
ncbi:hypothetical protein IWW45_001505 [Coemansia sp. RSA 485]|nr:hypothetical protein IWW45_001505 [Coemansia sp. RSA 485]